ncbi:lycopene cyclase [Subtercola sp. Z020]|uniref:lycopene cyclase domain-containing protein n=1 Tax=Subtercola sp. Z020 TaxID=2080582 RepID=UPI000CE79466|nr:lycopene cyclase domain-containing protein [Subtercola sp. Z020]PPF89740.1 lycopene cyclase [Subtercola sp. Z020]
MSYGVLNAIFLAVALVVAIVAGVAHHRRRRRHGDTVTGSGAGTGAGTRGSTGTRLVALLITAAVLFVVSAVFDNVMIGIGLVGYNRDLISGAFLGIAPLEDFAYVIGAVLLLPAVWLLVPARRQSEGSR